MTSPHEHAVELIETGGYLDRLNAALADCDVVEHLGKNRSKVIGSPAPWNNDAAGLLFAIHAGAREHETNLRWLAGWPARVRGGSDAMTRAALRNLPDLIELTNGARASTWPRDAFTALAGWPRQARVLFDEVRDDEKAPTKAPGGLSCPYCDKRLIIEPDWALKPAPILWCPSKGCAVDGARLEWPADEWIGALQAIEDDKKPVREPYQNLGSGRA